MWRAYYQTLKPERTYANVMTTAAGFLLACRWHVQWGLLLATIIGTTLVVLSACAANNCTDRGIDARMPRTRKRALVTGVLPVRNVALISVIFGLLGFAILAAWTNAWVVMLGVVAYIDYVVLYAWSKRHSVYSTLIGTISGAAPLVAGYVAVTDSFDATAWLLGLLMILWQMSHFYAIGIFRHDDYKAAKLPIWPVRYGVINTKRWIMAYTIGFLLLTVALPFTSTVGWLAGGVLIVSSVWWLCMGFKGYRLEANKWARGMFGYSLVIIMVLAAALSVSPLLP